MLVRPANVTIEEMHQLGRDILALGVRIDRLATNLDPRRRGMTEPPPLDPPTP